MADLPPIDFAGLAAALLDRAETLVPEWLPGGRVVVGEYVCGSLSGGEGGSVSISLKSGKWAEFNGTERGNDLISLYAAIHNLNNGQAAVQLMDMLGIQRARPLQTSARPSRPEPPAGDDRPAPPPMDERVPAVPGQAPPKSEASWKVIVPVPPHAAAPTFKHYYRGLPERTWCYERDGDVYGYIARFVTSDGGKETLPHVWCEETSDGRGLQRWHWKTWDEPRPLYLAAGLLAEDPRLTPVVLVEGEKCAAAGHELLGHEFDFVSWPGGCKGWAKADWSWLKGRVVFIWPDCDAKRVALTKLEREANIDPVSKPLLAESRQPGMKAMVSIGSLLVAEHGCVVSMVAIPVPGAVADGWDIADAIEQGWDAAQVRNYIRAAPTFVPPDDAARAKAAPTPPPAGAGDGDEDLHAWRSKLLTNGKGATTPCRENVILALDGLPGLPGIREAEGVIAFNEFTNDIIKLKDAPWGSAAGLWTEVDELLIGEWLVRQHWLPSVPRGTLEEAVRVVAYRRRYHPVREYLSGLQWDGKKRLSTWLRRACLEPAEWDTKDPLQQYLARVGTWYLQGMCARVMNPGVKFDYMMILEGRQGLRKSTLLNTLAGEWFADTGLVLGDKDSYQQLQGRWLYEIGELDAFNKTDITKIKQFIASTEDYFRASFDRRARPYPRQVVFGGTTNEDHYLIDPTGNRRFWPVRVTRLIDIDWVKENREQLLAEAMARNANGDRMFPMPEEERELFEPQQQLRQVENAIEASVYGYLYRDITGQMVNEVTLVGLLSSIGIGLEKLGPGRFHEKQAASALRRLGWTDKKSSLPGRPMVWSRPKADPADSSSTGLTPGHQQEGADDDCPF